MIRAQHGALPFHPVEWREGPQLLANKPAVRRIPRAQPKPHPIAQVGPQVHLSISLECIGSRKPLDCIHTIKGTGTGTKAQLSLLLDPLLGNAQPRHVQVDGAQLESVSTIFNTKTQLMVSIRSKVGETFTVQICIPLPSAVPNGSLLVASVQGSQAQLLVYKQAPCKQHKR
jgi:hypothetical protein